MERSENVLKPLLERRVAKAEPDPAQANVREHGGGLKFVRQKVVFFKVDDEAPYGDVVKFMDIVKGSGAKTLGVITKD